MTMEFSTRIRCKNTAPGYSMDEEIGERYLVYAEGYPEFLLSKLYTASNYSNASANA